MWCTAAPPYNLPSAPHSGCTQEPDPPILLGCPFPPRYNEKELAGVAGKLSAKLAAHTQANYYTHQKKFQARSIGQRQWQVGAVWGSNICAYCPQFWLRLEGYDVAQCESWEELEHLCSRFIRWCAEDQPGHEYSRKKPMVRSAGRTAITVAQAPCCRASPHMIMLTPPRHADRWAPEHDCQCVRKHLRPGAGEAQLAPADWWAEARRQHVQGGV